MRDAAVAPAWQAMPGHTPGRYSNHADSTVRELALAWRLSGASVTAGYQALRLQCGAHLVDAANAAARARGYKSAAAMRSAQ